MHKVSPGTFQLLQAQAKSTTQYKPKKVCDANLAAWLLEQADTEAKAPEGDQTPETMTPELSEAGEQEAPADGVDATVQVEFA